MRPNTNCSDFGKRVLAQELFERLEAAATAQATAGGSAGEAAATSAATAAEGADLVRFLRREKDTAIMQLGLRERECARCAPPSESRRGLRPIAVEHSCG